MINSTSNSDRVSPDSVIAWRHRYECLGLRTIPLIGKAPLGHLSWTAGDSSRLWNSVSPNLNCNIGIILGDGLAVVDADDARTAAVVKCGLNSMGRSPLAVQTPHGKHFYLRLNGAPVGYTWSHLPAAVGVGEFRAQKSYVVAPLSQVDGVVYRWMNGTPEDLTCQPVVQWRDLSWLLPEQICNPAVDRLPVRLLRRCMPARARALLENLSTASKGQAVDRYPSRSEAEAAVITELIFAGWPYEEILSAFGEWRPGKFWESKGMDRQRYFDRTYYRALSKIAAHPTRIAVASYWQVVSTDPLWVGRGGYTKRDTLLALLALCWQFGSWEVFAPQRALAEYVAATQFCISKTLRALCSDGLIERLNSGRDHADADHWRVSALGSLSSQVMICDNLSRTEEWDLNELWSASAMGRSAGTVYQLLSDIPVTVSWLFRRTGKAWSTVDAALERLERVGLSAEVGAGWVRGARTLREVADEFDTKGRARRRRERHIAQRELFAERLHQLAQDRTVRNRDE